MFSWMDVKLRKGQLRDMEGNMRLEVEKAGMCILRFIFEEIKLCCEARTEGVEMVQRLSTEHEASKLPVCGACGV